jgi:hypothetical protein
LGALRAKIEVVLLTGADGGGKSRVIKESIETYQTDHKGVIVRQQCIHVFNKHLLYSSLQYALRTIRLHKRGAFYLELRPFSRAYALIEWEIQRGAEQQPRKRRPQTSPNVPKLLELSQQHRISFSNLAIALSLRFFVNHPIEF